jgi:hypothetical protein
MEHLYLLRRTPGGIDTRPGSQDVNPPEKIKTGLSAMMKCRLLFIVALVSAFIAVFQGQAGNVEGTGVTDPSALPAPPPCSPSIPGLSASVNPVCIGGSTTLSVVSGTLGGAASWEWYTGSCGGTHAGSGPSIVVSPSGATTYYVRGEGGCVTNPGACGEITVNTGPVTTAAQVTNTCPNVIIEVPITVSSFNNVGAITLKLRYDKNVIRFTGYDNNSGLIDVCGADESGTTGVVNIIGTPDPPSMMGSGVLLTLKFTALGGSTDLVWDDTDDDWCQYGAGAPAFTAFCDDPTASYYINGHVTADPCRIPTLSEWGLIILGLVIMATGTVYMMRKPS